MNVWKDGIFIYFDETNWKAEYEQWCRESKQTDEEFEKYSLTQDEKIFNAFEGSPQELLWFKEGYTAAKTKYYKTITIRTNLLRDEKFFLQKKTKELIQAKQKIKDLVAECELYSGCLQEMESSTIVKCARFFQTFKNKTKRKLRTIYWSGKSFLRAFRPDIYDDRSILYKTLQWHLKKEDQYGNKINKEKK
jgi:hypothetical protein